MLLKDLNKEIKKGSKIYREYIHYKGKGNKVLFRTFIERYSSFKQDGEEYPIYCSTFGKGMRVTLITTMDSIIKQMSSED